MAMQIKICGITNVDDAVCAVNCGADMLGFIFYPPSPRYVEPAVARKVIAEVTGVETVGVFVDETPDGMRKVAMEAGLSAIQLHGSEPPEILDELDGYRLIKAVTIASPSDLATMDRYPNADILVDTPCPEHGGSGITGNWDLARAAAVRRPIILAGGVSPLNVAEAIRRVQPAGLDISSGVEQAKGIKDHDKIRAFFEAVRDVREDRS